MGSAMRYEYGANKHETAWPGSDDSVASLYVKALCQSILTSRPPRAQPAALTLPAAAPAPTTMIP